MGFVQNKQDGEEDPLAHLLTSTDISVKRESKASGNRGLVVDTDPLRCEHCRRELLPWQTECPDDGGAGVRSEDLPAREDELLSRFLENERAGALPDPEDVGPRDDDAAED